MGIKWVEIMSLLMNVVKDILVNRVGLFDWYVVLL